MNEGLFWKGNTLYGVCDDCGQLVRVNKPIFGSLHFCVPENERGTK